MIQPVSRVVVLYQERARYPRMPWRALLRPEPSLSLADLAQRDSNLRPHRILTLSISQRRQ